MLTEEQIIKIRKAQQGRYGSSGAAPYADSIQFARAIESAVEAPLLARIAVYERRVEAFNRLLEKQDHRVVELEAKLAQVEQDAQPVGQEPIGYMNAGHIYELQQKRIHYGYVYPKERTGAEIPVYTSPNQKDYEQELEAIVKQYKEYIVGLETKACTEISRLRAENATLNEKLDNLIK